MIGELLRYLTTFAPERIRKYGYLKRLIALEFRARRCADAWGMHRSRCKSFIVKAAELCAHQRVCVVVGSGLLLEVPLKELAEKFERVYLVDIFHMPQVQRAARRHFNVKLLTGDVTGCFAAIKENRPPGGHNPAPPARIPHLKEADLVVSCNCLTQLAGPFTAHFEKERGFSDLDSDKLAYQIMEQHCKAIAHDATGIGVIITDTERFVMQDDKVVSRTDLLKAYKLPLTPTIVHNEEWDWFFAPHPEEHPSHDYIHAVSGKIYQRNVKEEEKAEDGLAVDTTPPPPSLDDPVAGLGGLVPER